MDSCLWQRDKPYKASKLMKVDRLWDNMARQTIGQVDQLCWKLSDLMEAVGTAATARYCWMHRRWTSSVGFMGLHKHRMLPVVDYMTEHD